MRTKEQMGYWQKEEKKERLCQGWRVTDTLGHEGTELNIETLSTSGQTIKDSLVLVLYK